MEKFNCWLPTWGELHENIRSIANKIKEDNFRPDIIIALSRGGFVPARVICDLMIIKDLVSVKVDHWGVTAAQDGKAHLRYPIDVDLTGKKVLIVDDITDTGESMEIARDFVKKLNPEEIRTAAIFHFRHSKFVPDYYSKELVDWVWVMWPWNYIEDMCNITPKVLDESEGSSIGQIQKKLKERFKIDLTEQQIIEIMGVLVARKVAVENGIGWSKNKIN